MVFFGILMCNLESQHARALNMPNGEQENPVFLKSCDNQGGVLGQNGMDGPVFPFVWYYGLSSSHVSLGLHPRCLEAHKNEVGKNVNNPIWSPKTHCKQNILACDAEHDLNANGHCGLLILFKHNSIIFLRSIIGTDVITDKFPIVGTTSAGFHIWGYPKMDGF